jgi:hypothetical protein
MYMRRLSTFTPDHDGGGRGYDHQEEEVAFSKISSTELHAALDSLHIPFANLNRILIKQNATSIAAASPEHLLAYVSLTRIYNASLIFVSSSMTKQGLNILSE